MPGIIDIDQPGNALMWRSLFFAIVCFGTMSAARAEPQRHDAAGPGAATLQDDADKIRKPSVEMAPPASEDTTRRVRIGEVEMTIPLLKEYRDLDGLPDVYRSLFERVVPPSAELLDFHLHRYDIDMPVHEISPHEHYEIFVMKAYAAKQTDRKGWNDFRSEVSSALGDVDLAPLLKRNEARINDALTEHGVDMIKVEDLRTQAPKIYRSDERSMRLLATVANQQTIEGKVYRVEEVRATAVLYIRGKLLTVVAAKEFREGTSKPLEVVGKLDAFADRVLLLNL
ncbi:hypothetical protein [Lysobacter brunescens]|uniref:Secreted protein n=1 Tax=Lysobacter brunescens TaxID=262323 RepID=A0ABW2YBW6_9GAMM